MRPLPSRVLVLHYANRDIQVPIDDGSEKNITSWNKHLSKLVTQFHSPGEVKKNEEDVPVYVKKTGYINLAEGGRLIVDYNFLGWSWAVVSDEAKLRARQVQNELRRLDEDEKWQSNTEEENDG